MSNPESPKGSDNEVQPRNLPEGSQKSVKLQSETPSREESQKSPASDTPSKEKSQRSENPTSGTPSTEKSQRSENPTSGTPSKDKSQRSENPTSGTPSTDKSQRSGNPTSGTPSTDKSQKSGKPASETPSREKSQKSEKSESRPGSRSESRHTKSEKSESRPESRAGSRAGSRAESRHTKSEKSESRPESRYTRSEKSAGGTKSKKKSTRYRSIYYDGMLSEQKDRQWAPDPYEKPQPDWQMSPFPKERFDLDEEQKLEALGYRGTHKLSELRKLRGPPPPKKERPSFGACPTCGSTCGKDCSQKQAGIVKYHASVKCPPRYTYQPYGPAPIPVSTISHVPYATPGSYTPYGSPPVPAMKTSLYSSEKLPPRDYPEMNPLNQCAYYQAKPVYVPFGPMAELKVLPFEYTPLGPSVLPTTLHHL